jgi:hypothetical protein
MVVPNQPNRGFLEGAPLASNCGYDQLSQSARQRIFTMTTTAPPVGVFNHERYAVMATAECESCGTDLDSDPILGREDIGLMFCGDSCERQHVYASSDEVEDDDDEEDDESDDTDTVDDDEEEGEENGELDDEDDDEDDDDFDDDFDDEIDDEEDDDEDGEDDDEKEEDDDPSGE